MSEVLDDNYSQQAHAVCKSVIEEGGRVAVAVVVVVGGGSGGGSWWQWWLVARQASTSSLRQFARARSPLRASGHCLQDPRQVFEIPTPNLIDGIFEHSVMVSLQIKDELFLSNC